MQIVGEKYRCVQQSALPGPVNPARVIADVMKSASSDPMASTFEKRLFASHVWSAHELAERYMNATKFHIDAAEVFSVMDIAHDCGKDFASEMSEDLEGRSRLSNKSFYEHMRSNLAPEEFSYAKCVLEDGMMLCADAKASLNKAVQSGELSRPGILPMLVKAWDSLTSIASLPGLFLFYR